MTEDPPPDPLRVLKGIAGEASMLARLAENRVDVLKVDAAIELVFGQLAEALLATHDRIKDDDVLNETIKVVARHTYAGTRSKPPTIDQAQTKWSNIVKEIEPSISALLSNASPLSPAERVKIRKAVVDFKDVLQEQLNMEVGGWAL